MNYVYHRGILGSTKKMGFHNYSSLKLVIFLKNALSIIIHADGFYLIYNYKN